MPIFRLCQSLPRQVFPRYLAELAIASTRLYLLVLIIFLQQFRCYFHCRVTKREGNTDVWENKEYSVSTGRYESDCGKGVEGLKDSFECNILWTLSAI